MMQDDNNLISSNNEYLRTNSIGCTKKFLLTFNPTNIETIPLPIFGDFNKYIICEYYKKWGVKTVKLEEITKQKLNDRKDNFLIFVTLDLVNAIFTNDRILDGYCINYKKITNVIRKKAISYFPYPTYSNEIDDYVTDVILRIWKFFSKKLISFQKLLKPGEIPCFQLRKAQFWAYISMTCFSVYYDLYRKRLDVNVLFSNFLKDNCNSDEILNIEEYLAYKYINSANFKEDMDIKIESLENMDEQKLADIEREIKYRSKTRNFLSKVRCAIKATGILNEEETKLLYSVFPYSLSPVEGSTFSIKMRKNVEIKKIIDNLVFKYYGIKNFDINRLFN